MVRQKDERAKSRSKEYSDTRNNASRQELGIGDKVLPENKNQQNLPPNIFQNHSLSRKRRETWLAQQTRPKQLPEICLSSRKFTRIFNLSRFSTRVMKSKTLLHQKHQLQIMESLRTEHPQGQCATDVNQAI